MRKLESRHIDGMLSKLDQHRNAFFDPPPDQRPQRLWFVDSDVISTYINGTLRDRENGWASLFSIDAGGHSHDAGGERATEADELTDAIAQAVGRFIFGQFNQQLQAQQGRYYLTPEHERELKAIVLAVLHEAAEEGRNLVVVTDDAYFGLFYGAEVYQESLFARLAGLHERLLAVKVDGPTKEEFVWGFRTGMLTFGARAFLSDEALYQALEKKTAGAIRSAVSNCSHVAQSVLVKALAKDAINVERREKKGLLEERAKKVISVLGSPKFANLWEPYPFNAGYFMCLKLKGLDAETYRKHLLEKYGVGVIADGDRDIRIAFSSVDANQIEDLYNVLATAARELLDGQGSAGKK